MREARFVRLQQSSWSARSVKAVRTSLVYKTNADNAVPAFRVPYAVYAVLAHSIMTQSSTVAKAAAAANASPTYYAAPTQTNPTRAVLRQAAGGAFRLPLPQGRAAEDAVEGNYRLQGALAAESEQPAGAVLLPLSPSTTVPY